MPSQRAETNAVISLNAQADKFHRQWYAVELHGAVCSYVTWEAVVFPGGTARRLSDRPLNQTLKPVVIVVGERLLLSLVLSNCCSVMSHNN